MRAPPKNEPAKYDSPTAAGVVTQVREYELITPLFGGGVKKGENDDLTPIRGSEIRGQLRFWWRACRGGQFAGDLKAMKEAESLIWGAASTEKKPRPSQVQIVARAYGGSNSEMPYAIEERLNREGRTVYRAIAVEAAAPAYASFPLKPRDEDVRNEQHDTKINSIKRGVKFGLTISFRETVRSEVEAALWAWETFGGVGARTRRGFGASKLLSIEERGTCTKVALPQPTELATQITVNWKKHVHIGKWPDNVPHLEPSWDGRLTSEQSNPQDAWNRLIGFLRAFRQDNLGRPPARGAGGRPGRSYWSEPDAIRRLFLPGRTPRHTPSPLMPDKFPRAALGLPIIFKFKADDEIAGDPPQTTLQGASKDTTRFASPLILRPIACAGGKAVGVAVVLKNSTPPPLELDGAPGNPKVKWTLASTEAGNIQPLRQNATIYTDVLEAFLKTVK